MEGVDFSVEKICKFQNYLKITEIVPESQQWQMILLLATLDEWLGGFLGATLRGRCPRIFRVPIKALKKEGGRETKKKRRILIPLLCT